MNPQELEYRIAASNRELRRKLFWIALFPLIVFFTAIGTVLLKLTFWPLGAIIFVTPFLMSILLTQLVNGASVRAGLTCPHCNAPLGGFIKQARRGVCPNCSAALFDGNSSAALKSAVRKPSIASIIFITILCLAGSAYAYWLAYQGLEQGHIFLPSRVGSKIVSRLHDPDLFWLAVVAWLLCGTSPILLLAVLRYKAIKHGAQQGVQADVHESHDRGLT